MKTLSEIIAELPKGHTNEYKKTLRCKWVEKSKISGNYKIDNLDSLKKMFCIFMESRIKNFQYLRIYDAFLSKLYSPEKNGLILSGNCGKGKSMCLRFLQEFFLDCFGCNVEMYDERFLFQKIDNLKMGIINALGVVIVDDIGICPEVIQYGDRRIAFAELMDMSERRGTPVYGSTNLTLEQIKIAYGVRTIERIRSCCNFIKFDGESFRQ